MRGPEAGRVLVVFHESRLGGATRSVLAVVDELEERGWRFAFWAPKPGAAYEALSGHGRAVLGCERPIRFSWASLRQPPGALARLRATPRYLRAFTTALNSFSPSLVHANTLLAVPEALLARASGYRTLVHVHEMLPATAKGWAAAQLLRAAADSVVTVSNASAAALARGGVRAAVVWNGLASPVSGARVDARREQVVVGTVGTISHRKASDVVVRAASEVRARCPEVEFRVIGDVPSGRESAWGEAVATDLAHAGVVHRRGAADVLAELAEWDVFVLPSRDDPFPLAVLEAMASGLPVVAAAVGGIVEQVSPDAGILVPPNDAAALADAVVRLVQSPAERRRMGEAGRERVEREFPRERQVRGLEAAYRATVASGGLAGA